MAANIYVPNLNSGNCVVLQNSSTIRVYDTQPTNNSTINYTDYYFTSNYYFNRGTQTFSNYSTLPTCRTDITTDFYYRYDFDKIMIIFICILIILYFMAFKPISRLFGRWLKL